MPIFWYWPNGFSHSPEAINPVAFRWRRTPEAVVDRASMDEETFDNARWLIGAIARGLHRSKGDAIPGVLERLAEQDLGDAAFQRAEPHRLPVLRHLPQAIGETMLFDADIAAAIAALEDHFNWRQSAAYTDERLGQGFCDNYGWTEIVGPHGFFPGDDFLLGLLILGPDRHYTDHYHPAPELYWPLTGGTAWRQGTGTFEINPAGAAIWHPSMVPHATRTREAPLLAVWSWTSDTGTPARLA